MPCCCCSLLRYGFLVYHTTNIKGGDLVGLMFIPSIWIIYGWLIHSLRIDRGYYTAFRFLTRKSRSYKAFKRLEKRYLPQEELITAKIKSHLGNDVGWNASLSFLSRDPKLPGYIEKAQEKIGSAYPAFKSDIKKAKQLITNRYERSQPLDDSDSSRSSSKTIATKNASSKTKSVRQDSSNPDSVAPSQPISPPNPSPPPHTSAPSITAKGKAKLVQPRLTNWEQANASRLKIGNLGEVFVYQYEQAKLKRLGLGHLIEKIEHSSKVIGDGLGYDIKSFNRSGEVVYIEVKTTKGEFWTNLMFTRNELDFAKQNSSQFLLYRVYAFDEETRSGELYIGSYAVIETYFSFEPQSFAAKPKKAD